MQLVQITISVILTLEEWVMELCTRRKYKCTDVTIRRGKYTGFIEGTWGSWAASRGRAYKVVLEEPPDQH